MEIEKVATIKDITKHINVSIPTLDRYSENSFYNKYPQVLKKNFNDLPIAPILVYPTKELICQISEKIPYIFFDSNLPNTKRLTFIRHDSFKSGMLDSRLMNMLIADNGNITMTRMLPEDYYFDQGTKGFENHFPEQPFN